jgi:hypothetical protein
MKNLFLAELKKLIKETYWQEIRSSLMCYNAHVIHFTSSCHVGIITYHDK